MPDVLRPQAEFMEAFGELHLRHSIKEETGRGDLVEEYRPLLNVEREKLLCAPTR
jgi:hypothetical protein